MSLLLIWIWMVRARTFMRSLLQNETTVGILLFDEPSASLDPTAEHGTFLRIKRLEMI